MARIELSKRKQVVHLHESGISGRQIAKQLKMCHGSVQKILKKHKAGLGVENLPKSGRPRIFTPRMARCLTIEARKHPQKTARELIQAVNLIKPASLATVKRELRRGGLFGRIAIKKPFLTNLQKIKRRKWCTARRLWTLLKWKLVIFSDECKLDLHPNRRIYIRRPIGSRIRPSYLSCTRKFSKSIMVWGAIRGDGHTVLVLCDGNVDSQEYQRILSIGLPQIYKPRTLFQQDGATCHRSRSTSDFLARKKINLLPDWPPQSPDLNIIEHLWDYLKYQVNLRKPQTLDELWTVAQQEWNAIPREKIEKLYESIPRRVKAVLASRGGQTKY